MRPTSLLWLHLRHQSRSKNETNHFERSCPLVRHIVPAVAPPPEISGPGWEVNALCAGKTELFFEAPGEREGRRKRREAKACSYCAQCPVAVACREAGRLNREHGIWGGETDEQRARAGYPPRNISRRGVAQARREGIARQSEAPPTMAEFQIRLKPSMSWLSLLRGDAAQSHKLLDTAQLSTEPRTRPGIDSTRVLQRDDESLEYLQLSTPNSDRRCDR